MVFCAESDYWARSSQQRATDYAQGDQKTVFSDRPGVVRGSGACFFVFSKREKHVPGPLAEVLRGCVQFLSA